MVACRAMVLCGGLTFKLSHFRALWFLTLSFLESQANFLSQRCTESSTPANQEVKVEVHNSIKDFQIAFGNIWDTNRMTTYYLVQCSFFDTRLRDKAVIFLLNLIEKEA